MTRDSLLAFSRSVDGLRRDVCGRLVVLREDVRVETEGDHNRGVAEPLGDHLRGDASSKTGSGQCRKLRGRGRVGGQVVRYCVGLLVVSVASAAA